MVATTSLLGSLLLLSPGARCAGGRADAETTTTTTTTTVVDSHAFILRWPSKVTAPSASVFAFELTVAAADDDGSGTAPAPWQSGLVWRENTTAAGAAACCGNATWTLRAATRYTWSVVEYLQAAPRHGPTPLGAAVSGVFATSATLPTPREEARSVASGSAAAKVYTQTRDSIRSRVKVDGFFGESPYAHEYGALEFIRTLGAATAAFLEMGDDALVKRILALVLGLHLQARPGQPGYAFPVHTIGPVGNYSVDGQRSYTMEHGNEQTDGSFHLVVAWARYCALHPEETAMFHDHYEMMKRWTLRYATPFPTPSSRPPPPPGPCKFDPPTKHSFLAGYAPGVSNGALPYPNTLAAAQEYCCKVNAAAAGSCGGITQQATGPPPTSLRYECRASAVPKPASGATSWVVANPRGALVTPLFNESLGLVFNPNLEHSRDDHYWPCYDLIANTFAEEALRLMGTAATRANDTAGAAAFAAFRSKLQSGLARSLSHTVDGIAGNIYGELRPLGPGGIKPDDPSTPDEYVWGMSWVNLAPIPAYASVFTGRNETVSDSGLSMARMDATVAAYRQQGFFVWEAAADDPLNRSGAEIALTHLNASTHGLPFWKPSPRNLQVQAAAIGKGFGWELLYAAYRGDWQRVTAMERFVGEWTYGAVYERGQEPMSYFGESYWYNRYIAAPTVNSYESDPGNGEQVCWFVFCQHAVLRLLGEAP